MRSPGTMKDIQIDITNACVNKCSNCTRFCGHHRKPYFMDFETFKKAVDSFDGWNGGVGIIGGEPTLHPEFEKFVTYLRDKRLEKPLKVSRKPIYNMQSHIMNNLVDEDAKLGLWCSLNKGYYRHFEVINDTFPKQYLNDHDNKCMHQAILVSRKELGIPDEEFIHKRDNCFAQNNWSATITPKGAFFCEIAAHLDLLFNGPGGWPIEKGWYNRQPEEFGEQLQWCEMCGLCLDVPQRLSWDERDDVTPLILEKLKQIDSPKVAQGKYVILEPELYKKNQYNSFKSANDYMDAGGNVRTSTQNRNYYPRSFEILPKEDVKTAFENKTVKDWIVIGVKKDTGTKIAEELKDFVLNPGCLYEYKGSLIFNILASSVRDYVKQPDNFDVDKLRKYYPKDKIIKIKNLNKSSHKTINILGFKLSFKRRDNE